MAHALKIARVPLAGFTPACLRLIFQKQIDAHKFLQRMRLFANLPRRPLSSASDLSRRSVTLSPYAAKLCLQFLEDGDARSRIKECVTKDRHLKKFMDSNCDENATNAMPPPTSSFGSHLGTMRLRLRGLPKREFTAILARIRSSLPPKYICQTSTDLRRGILSVPLRTLDSLVRHIPELAPTLANTPLISKLNRICESLRPISLIDNCSSSICDIVVPRGCQLLPHQISALDALCRMRGNCILADDMGLGKTVVAVLHATMAKAMPCLILCPNSITSVWMDHIHVWAPSAKSFVVNSGTYLPLETGFDFVVVPYHLLRILKKSSPQLWDSLTTYSFRQVVCDEAHMLKNFERARTAAALKLISNVPNCLFLSGTPLINSASELFVYLSVLHRRVLADIPGRKSIWKSASNTSFARLSKKFSMLPDLAVLMGSVTVRRMKDDVLQLPSKYRQIVRVDTPTSTTLDSPLTDWHSDYSRKVARLGPPDRYRSDLPHVRFSLLKFGAVDSELHGGLDARTRLLIQKAFSSQQAATLNRILEERMLRNLRRTPEQRAIWGPAPFPKNLRYRWQRDLQVFFDMTCHLRHLTALYKVPATVKLVQQLLSDGKGPVVVFAHHKDVITFVCKALRYSGFTCALLSGDMDADTRSGSVSSFQEGRFDVLLATMNVAREGITLTASSQLIMMEHSFSPCYDIQCEDRLYRIGQHREVTVSYMFAPRTMDEYFVRLIDDKRSIFNSVIGSPLSGVSMETLMSS